MRTFMLTLTILCCAVFFAAVVGCQTKPPVGSVSGKITLNDKPLAEQVKVIINFINAQGRGDGCFINADGSYSIPKLEVGDYKVSVMADIDPMGGEDGKPKAKSAIPAKYGEAETSGLVFSVKAGANTFDINLK